jgi:hypothetical protein
MSINKLLFAGIMSVGLLASCAGDEAVPNQATSSKTLAINLQGAPSFRSALSTTSTTDESMIHRVVVGIFDKSTQNVKAIQEFTTTSTSVSVSANSSVAVGDSVIVAVNPPTSGMFSGVLKISDFHSKLMDMSYSTSSDLSTGTDGSTQTGQALPMYGCGAAVASGSNFAANVDIYHLISKISLSPVNVSFDQNGAYANATFTPTEVFLYNVPKHAYFNFVSPFYTTENAYLHGEKTSTITGLTYAEYLGTGTVSGTPLSKSTTTAAIPSTLYFYTAPNTDAKSTRLIIKGNFNDGTTTTNDIYYPVVINHAQTGTGKTTGASDYTADGKDSYILPNRSYNINVTIKSIGITDPSKTIDPAAVNVVLTVKDFTPITQNVTFN